MYKINGNLKCTESPRDDLEHLMVKIMICTLTTKSLLAKYVFITLYNQG